MQMFHLSNDITPRNLIVTFEKQLHV